MDNSSINIENIQQNQETKKCKYCKSDIDKNAKFCPYCRKKQKSVAGKIILAIILIILVLFVGLYILYDIRTRQLADSIGKELIASGVGFDRYEIEKGDGGYWTIVYLNDQYGPNSYMKHLVEGYSSSDVAAAGNYNNWNYCYKGVETTYTSFMTSLALDMYADEYKKVMDTYTQEYNDILDTYSDYLDEYMDMFK